MTTTNVEFVNSFVNCWSRGATLLIKIIYIMIYLWLEVFSTSDSPFSDCLYDRRGRFCHPSSRRSIRTTINVLFSATQMQKLCACINRHRYLRVRICQFSVDIVTSSYNNRRSEIRDVQYRIIRKFVKYITCQIRNCLNIFIMQKMHCG